MGRNMWYSSVTAAVLLWCSTAAAQGVPGVSDNVYDVTRYGVIGDSLTMNTAAIQKVIDTATKKGGGVVYFPPGTYLTGSLFLKSNITLYLENGCILYGSGDLDDYVPTREERAAYDCRRERHLIYAENLENIAIRGQGIIDGNGPSFWPVKQPGWTESDLRNAMIDERGFSTRPGQCLVFSNCRNLLLEDVTLRYSPIWMMGIIGSENVRLRDISIIQGIFENDGPNTDGVNVSSSRDVRISGCEIITGDDCMVLGGDNRNITVANCTFSTTESAIVLSPGRDMRNIAIANCTVFDAGSCITARIGRGSLLDGVSVSNLVYQLDRQVGGNLLFMRTAPIELNPGYQAYLKKFNLPAQERPVQPTGILRNAAFSNITALCDGAVFISGLEDGKMENITLDNIRFTMRGNLEKRLSADPPHPFFVFGHKSAPYGIYCRYIKGLTLRNVEFHWNTPEQSAWGSAVRCLNVTNLCIDGFDGRQSLGSDQPALLLRDVDGAFIRNCRAATGAGTFLSMDGSTRNVSLISNDLHQAQHAFTVTGAADRGSVREQANILPEKP